MQVELYVRKGNWCIYFMTILAIFCPITFTRSTIKYTHVSTIQSKHIEHSTYKVVYVNTGTLIAKQKGNISET